MKIEHVCLNVKDIEKEKDFYVQAFGFKANAKYHNAKTGWENYFLAPNDGGARLELLSHADMPLHEADRKATCIVHLSFSLGSEEAVDQTTEKLVCLKDIRAFDKTAFRPVFA